MTDSPLLPIIEEPCAFITSSFLAKSIEACSYCYTTYSTAKTLKPVRAGRAQRHTRKYTKGRLCDTGRAEFDSRITRHGRHGLENII